MISVQSFLSYKYFNAYILAYFFFVFLAWIFSHLLNRSLGDAFFFYVYRVVSGSIRYSNFDFIHFINHIVYLVSMFFFFSHKTSSELRLHTRINKVIFFHEYLYNGFLCLSRLFRYLLTFLSTECSMRNTLMKEDKMQSAWNRPSLYDERIKIATVFCINSSSEARLACVASVSVWFRSKERPWNGILGFGRARNETRAKRAIFLAVFDSRSSFSAPRPHGNACYAG